MIEKPQHTIFYEIEKTIKTYRKFALKNIQEKFRDLTIDQALLIQFLHNNPTLSQTEIAALIFKDNASVTRMIELMVKKKYLKRSIDNKDRRKFKIELTKKTTLQMNELNNIILNNREIALNNIDKNNLENLKETLKMIINNCK